MVRKGAGDHLGEGPLWVHVAVLLELPHTHSPEIASTQGMAVERVNGEGSSAGSRPVWAGVGVCWGQQGARSGLRKASQSFILQRTRVPTAGVQTETQAQLRLMNKTSNNAVFFKLCKRVPPAPRGHPSPGPGGRRAMHLRPHSYWSCKREARRQRLAFPPA